MIYLETNTFDNVEAFVKAFNKLRIDYKNKWIAFVGNVAGKSVRVKSYSTYIQILEIDGVKHGGCIDCSVKVWKETLTKAIIA